MSTAPSTSWPGTSCAAAEPRSKWSTLIDFARSGGATVLSVEVGGTALRKGPHTGVPIASHAMPGTWDAASSTMTLDGAGFVIRVACLPDADGTFPYGRDELLRVADGLTLASRFSDKSTWFPAATALH
ncbi:MAG: hypothetical protein DLM57_16865 [Pseudonocardiales bacterium]|nr:MAG: hypothetical protein DLM57_16865 [Pseudonocardiales bacterium]